MDENSLYSEAIGNCGCCGSDQLSYGALEIGDGNMVYYPFECEECGAQGKEWYELSYNCTEMSDTKVEV